MSAEQKMEDLTKNLGHRNQTWELFYYSTSLNLKASKFLIVADILCMSVPYYALFSMLT